MPTNPNAPFGFQLKFIKDGVSANYGLRTGLIASANGHEIFTGDVLKPLAAGYLDVAVEVGGGEQVGGVVKAFEWQSRSQNKTVYQNYWPGNGDAIGDVTCYYYAHPECVFEAQCLLGPLTQADVGSNINFDVGSGGVTIGAGNQSSFTLDDGDKGAGASLPFKIYRLPVEGPSAAQLSQAGYDVTLPYNRVWVTFNNLVA